MKVLQHKTTPELYHIVKHVEKESDYWHIYLDNKNIMIPLCLVSENRKGWTFENYSLTSTQTIFFFPRSEYEIAEYIKK